MRAVGAAVAGTGFIGPVHVEALRRLGHRVVGVLGSSPEKGTLAADALGVPTAYRSFDELLADPVVEVVHLATPNRDHFEQCRQAIAAGKHVVCEKPLAMTSAETAGLVKLAAANPRLVTAVNYNVRFYPLCLEAREQVRSGRLGEVYHVTGSYLQDWLLHPSDFNWRVLAEHGGELRAVADIGTHWLDLVTFVTGLEVEAVCADLRTVHPVRQKPTGGSETFIASAGGGREAGVSIPVTTEDYGSILLRFLGGARGCLSVSQVTAGRKNCLRFDVAGGGAALAWDSEEPNVLRVGHRDRPNETLTRDPALLSRAARPFANYPGGHAEGFPDSFKQLFRAVYGAILASPGCEPGGSLYPTFADGHREVLLCEAILRSHREQRWVPLPGAESNSPTR
jgi:predicted dehydrogenase